MSILLVANTKIMHLKMLIAARARGLSLPACAQLSLSASVLFPERLNGAALSAFQLKHIYVVSLILHASIAEITLRAIVFIVAYSISSDDGSIINQDFCADQHLGSESCM